MPITDTFDATEFKTALENADNAAVVQGFLLDEVNAENPVRKTIRSKFVDPAFSEHYKLLDGDIKTLTGIEKQANEKSIDYLKRAINESKITNEQQRTSLQAELEKLKQSAGTSDEKQKRIEQLEGLLNTKDTEFKTFKENSQKERTDFIVGNDLNTAFAKVQVNYNKDIPAFALTAAEKETRAWLHSIAKVQDDGVVTYIGEDGNPIIDDKTYKPKSAEQLIKERMKSVLTTEERQQNGGGTQGFPTGEKDKDGKNLVVPASVTNQVQLGEFLVGKGYKEGTPEYDKMWQKIQSAKNYPLT